MRFLFVTGRETQYQRNDVLLRAFKRIGEVEVVGVVERPRSIAWNSFKLSIELLPKLLRRSYDLIFVGFYGQLIMYPVRFFSRAPILFDAFISTYDTLSSDRKLVQPGSISGRFLIEFDRAACSFASHVLLDTQAHADYFVDMYDLKRPKVSAIPVGCNEDIFFPQPGPQPDSVTRVLHYSSYLPLHGVNTIVRAAQLLQGKPIEFLLIGDGQSSPKIKDLAANMGLNNIRFVNSIPLTDLPAEIAAADICLGGHFGDSDKAARVIPGKIYQMLAMERPVIASDRGANIDLLQHDVSALLCTPNDPEDLSRAILRLHEDVNLRREIAKNGRQAYLAFASEKVITASLMTIVRDLVN